MTALAKPRRSRANLRPPSRSACVIDQLLKNQNPLEKRNNLRSSSPHLVVGRRPENRAAILRSEIHGHGSHGCSDRWCSVRAFDVSTAMRSAAAASQGPRPRRVTRWLAASTIAPPGSSALFNRDNSGPHHAILDRKIAARLFRRCPQPVKSRIIPDSFMFFNGFCLMETA